MSGSKRYECREGKMYRSSMDVSLWIRLPIQIVIEMDEETTSAERRNLIAKSRELTDFEKTMIRQKTREVKREGSVVLSLTLCLTFIGETRGSPTRVWCTQGRIPS